VHLDQAEIVEEWAWAARGNTSKAAVATAEKAIRSLIIA
jgi:hypothetical protein